MLYARVAKFEGTEEDQMREMVEEVGKETGPPEGVPGIGFMMFVDYDSGTSYGISFYNSEEDMKAGDETLNAMTGPSGDGAGRRASVELMEAPIRIWQGQTSTD